MLKQIKVSGTHFECGRQIGAACAEQIRAMVANDREQPPEGWHWEDFRQAALPYLAATERAFPWVVEEIRGAADGAGLDFLDLFAEAVEELFTASPPEGRCSDFAACAPATADGHVLLGHNNDLSPSTQDNLVAVEWDLPDQPCLFTIGVGGIFVSIGVNAARIALTGNELSPNDERPGLPRLLIARALLSARTFDEALTIALHPDRASSYNNLLSSADGRVASVEASATDHELLWPEAGWLVHTNHYLHPRMTRYERAPDKIAGSISRYARADELMRTRPSPVTLPMLQGFLSDHGGSPTPLCRHAGRSQTVFSALIDLTEGVVLAKAGRPCEGEFAALWSLGAAAPLS